MSLSLITVPANCEYMDQPGTYLPFTDTYLSRVNDIEECRSRCTIQNKYNCRSFNYNAFRKECFLSSDDSISLPDGLHTDRDFIFSERGGCNSGILGTPGIKGERANQQDIFNFLAFSMFLFQQLYVYIFNTYVFSCLFYPHLRSISCVLPAFICFFIQA